MKTRRCFSTGTKTLGLHRPHGIARRTGGCIGPGSHVLINVRIVLREGPATLDGLRALDPHLAAFDEDSLQPRCSRTGASPKRKKRSSGFAKRPTCRCSGRRRFWKPWQKKGSHRGLKSPMRDRVECVMLKKGTHVLCAMRVLDDILRRMRPTKPRRVRCSGSCTWPTL